MHLAPLVLSAALLATPTAKLAVNTDDSTRHTTRVSLQDGLSSLEDVVFFSPYEEIWAYDARRAEWLEIGYESSGWNIPARIEDMQSGIVRVGNRVRLDTALFERAYADDAVHAHIHIHPLKDAPDYKRTRLVEGYAQNARAIALVKISHALPSPDDLGQMRYELNLAQRTAPFSFYIASYAGVTAFHLTPEGRAQMRGVQDDAPLVALVDRTNAAVHAALQRHAHDARIDPTTVLQEGFADASDELFRIRFASYRDLSGLWHE